MRDCQQQWSLWRGSSVSKVAISAGVEISCKVKFTAKNTEKLKKFETETVQ